MKMGKTAESKNWKGRNTDMIDVSNSSTKKNKLNTKYKHKQIPEYLQTVKGKPEVSKTSTTRMLTIIYDSRDEIEEERVVEKKESRMKKSVKWIKKYVCCIG